MIEIKEGIVMSEIALSREEFRDKVFACWLGKNIGGTLGGPWECRKYVNDLTFYDPVPDGSAPNDDLDLQLVWLKMMEDQGVPPKLPHFADYWMKYACAYPWNEYGFCMRNLVRGLRPPVSGCFENYYVDEMGSPIRSEIWACLAPANPQRAAALAWMDSALDHAGGEGMHGEMFWAAVESAAFVLSDPLALIRIGLAMIPISCAISRSIREAVWCWHNGRRCSEARQRILDNFGHNNPCDAKANHGFTILGWLYGEDFGDKLCRAVNCAYDTDCTGATLGSLLGIIGGTAGIPKKWSGPVGTGIVLHKFTGDCDAPRDLDELTDRTLALTEKMGVVTLADRTELPGDIEARLMLNREAVAARAQAVDAAVELSGDLEIVLHYNGDPVLQPGVARRIGVSLRRDGAPVGGEVELIVPDGWSAARTGDGSAFDVAAPAPADSNEVMVRARVEGRDHVAPFVVLGPGAARGFGASINIEKCRVCQGRKESCICNR